MSKINKIILTSIVFAVFCAVCLKLFPFWGFGHLHIRVVDAYTLMPVKGAKVIIPDINRSIIADDSGSCIFTDVPIRTNSLHQKLLPQDWGECTIIAVFDGYRPTVLLNTRVEKNQMRSGPTLYMFPEATDEIEVAAIVESPDDAWISHLVEKYS